MKILVAEDDPIQASAIQMFLRKIDFELVKLVDNAEDFLEAARSLQADVALLDIFIRGKHDGIALAQMIQEEEIPLAIVFLTSVKDESVFERARRVSPQGFLLKPFDEIILKRHLLLALDQFREQNSKNESEDSVNFTASSFLVRTGDHLRKIEVEEIQALEVEDKYVRLNTAKGTFRIRTSLQAFESHLSPEVFVRIGRSTIVNINGFESLNTKTRVLTIYGKNYPLSRAAQEEILRRFQSFK